MIARRAALSVSAFALWLFCALPTHGQAPTGTIAGVITDPAGAPVAGARLSIVNRDSGLTRNLTTSAEGDYSAAALPPGVYQVTAEAAGFGLLERTATVEAGTTTTANLSLQIGDVTAQVKVDDAAPLINYEQHQVGGVINRAQIESLPLNGRNFLDLAKLEPGVTNPTKTSDNRVFVSVLGAGVFGPPRIGSTRVTVDGASIVASGLSGAELQVSQDAVQEFQISTVNFDLSTSMTTDGAINIVTRSGGNRFHGGGFYFYRDHNLSAYPGLQRDSSDPDPFFQRKQFGYQVSGPIRKDRFFFFTDYERNDQRGVLSIQPRSVDFAALGVIFPNPYLGNQFNLRFDGRLNRNQNAFLRYTHDGNRAFGPTGGGTLPLPSGWSPIKNWVDQSIVGLTSVLSPSLVNDLRFSYLFNSGSNRPATIDECAGCFGVGLPRINIADAGLLLGNSRTLSVVERRYQLTEGLAWQRGNHRLRFGFDWEHTTRPQLFVADDPANITLYSPREVRQFNATAPPATQIPLPSSFLTVTDILKLPLKSYTTSVGSGYDLERHFLKYRIMDQYRLYAADTWRISPRLTMNYGVAWSYEPHSLNTDLTKPKLLTAILGLDHLNPPVAQKANFSPTAGFAWAATSDGKTVIRGGAGRYFDPVNSNSADIANERLALSPIGTGRKSVPGSSISYQGLPPFDFQRRPTRFTGADLLTILPSIRAGLLQQLNPDNRDFTIRNIDADKTGSNLSDPFYQTPYALHFSLGVQRELARNLVLSVDLVERRFLHVFLGGIDYNRFNSAQGPVIPRCSPAQKNDVTAACSNGQITFDNTTGIAQYKGLLVRIEKRFSGRTQLLASYALGSYNGSNGPGIVGGGFNNDNWFENYGSLPTDLRHILNLSGIVDLPRRFRLSFSMSAYSRPPFSAYVSGIDFNGDGTTSDLLPGTKVNQFNRGLGKDDLARSVAQYNQQFAGKPTIGGQIAPTLMLPANYSFNDKFFTQDLRLSRTFSLGGERISLVLLGEVFNLFNTANLVQYSGNLNDPSSFGQPTSRVDQVFGSGGPRAFQLGARLSF
jgi:hypothetical protein